MIAKKAMLSLISIALSIGLTSSNATTPRNFETLFIDTGKPAIRGESAISISQSWHVDGKIRFSGTGLTFINGPGAKQPDNAVSVASKILTAVSEGLMAQEPSRRGIEIEQLKSPEGDLLPSLKINNKQGHSLNNFVIRDYSHQQPVAYQVNPAFSEDGVAAAIDVVYKNVVAPTQSLVEEEEETSYAQLAVGGGIEITVGNYDTVTIETTNLTVEQIEQALASSLSASAAYVANEMIFEELVNKATRNVKPFDGQEVQFKSLSGDSIEVSVNDPSISVIIKLQYPDESNSRLVIPMPLIFLIFGVVLTVIGYIVWKSKPDLDSDQDPNQDKKTF